MTRKSILIIGAVPHDAVPKTYGGTTVLMTNFINFLKLREIPFELIQANYYLGRFSAICNLVYICFNFLRKLKHFEIVMVNVSSRGLFFIAPLIYYLSIIVKKKYIFRMFGGDFIQLYNKSGSLKKSLLANTVFNADLLIFETKKIINYISDNKLTSKKKLFWLPNVRESLDYGNIKTLFNRRFVFISHVKKTKGIIEIIEASKTLPSGYVIDIYGPLMDKDISSVEFSDTRVRYKGALEPQKVHSVLEKYNVLILPTYHLGEGYPGIIIEALFHGIPIIATTWGGIDEIISHNKEGILIPIKDSKALRDAILFFNESNYKSFSSNALSRSRDFDSKNVYDGLLEQFFKL